MVELTALTAEHFNVLNGFLHHRIRELWYI